MPSTNHNPTEIDGSKLSNEQLASAAEFLAGRNWHGDEPTRKTRHVDIARLLAWYGAIRFQAGANGIGTLEQPGRPINVTSAPQPNLETEFEITDLDFRALVTSNEHL